MILSDALCLAGIALVLGPVWLAPALGLSLVSVIYVMAGGYVCLIASAAIPRSFRNVPSRDRRRRVHRRAGG